MATTIQFEPTIGAELPIERHGRKKQGAAQDVFADLLGDQLKKRAEAERLQRITARHERVEQVSHAADTAAGRPPRLVLSHHRAIRGEATVVDEPGARNLFDQSRQSPDQSSMAEEAVEPAVEIEAVTETPDVIDDKEQASDQIIAPVAALLPAEQQPAENTDGLVIEIDPAAALDTPETAPARDGTDQAASGKPDDTAAEESTAEAQLAEAVVDANLSAAVGLLETDGAVVGDVVAEVAVPEKLVIADALAAKPTPLPAQAGGPITDLTLPAAPATRPVADLTPPPAAGARAAEIVAPHASPAPAPVQAQAQPHPAATLQPSTQVEAGAGTFESATLAGDEVGPGWAVHLAQGAAAKRTEFVAQLRQHLQNLPAHEQVAVHMQRALREGTGRFSIQLSPAELGRVQVKLEIDEDNRVKAAVTVERPGTLELLQRDIKGLERALHEAGLKMDGGDLSFSLGRSSDQDWAQDQNQFGSAGAGQVDLPSDADQPETTQDDVLDTAAGIVNVQV
jgi:flagellar hook-length control protein FliK